MNAFEKELQQDHAQKKEAVVSVARYRLVVLVVDAGHAMHVGGDVTTAALTIDLTPEQSRLIAAHAYGDYCHLTTCALELLPNA